MHEPCIYDLSRSGLSVRILCSHSSNLCVLLALLTPFSFESDWPSFFWPSPPRPIGFPLCNFLGRIGLPSCFPFPIQIPIRSFPTPSYPTRSSPSLFSLSPVGLVSPVRYSHSSSDLIIPHLGLLLCMGCLAFVASFSFISFCYHRWCHARWLHFLF